MSTCNEIAHQQNSIKEISTFTDYGTTIFTVVNNLFDNIICILHLVLVLINKTIM